MALISAKTIITSLSLFHITLAFFFLTNPATIADQALVYVLGESMGMVSPDEFFSPQSCYRRPLTPRPGSPMREASKTNPPPSPSSPPSSE